MSQEKIPIRFDGQAAIVTGSGGGIGRAIALELAVRGAKVLVNDYGGDTYGHAGDSALADRVVAEIRTAGGVAVANATAVGTHAAARKIVAAAIEAFGHVDILANNAGVSLPGLITDFTDREVENHFRINLLGAYAMVRAIWPHLRAQGYGRILNTSSNAALGIGANAPYSTTKAGLIGLTLDAAIEGGPHHILVNAMMPAAYSRMIKQIPDPAFVDWFRNNLPAEKVGASAAYFLSSASSVTGRIIVMGGGRVARVAFAENRGIMDAGINAEKIHAQWPVIDDMGGCQIDDSNADAMAMYTDAFPFAGGGVPKLDQGAVVGAGKANQDDSQLGDE